MGQTTIHINIIGFPDDCIGCTKGCGTCGNFWSDTFKREIEYELAKINVKVIWEFYPHVQQRENSITNP